MAGQGETDNTPNPEWTVECKQAARDRMRRRLGGGNKQRTDQVEETAPPLRARGKLARPREDEVISLRFDDADRKPGDPSSQGGEGQGASGGFR